MSERRGTKALELWCRRIIEGYPGIKVENMTMSWRNGLAFCALIHHFRPDLIDFEKLNKSDVYYNNKLAFTTAEKYLGIPALLDAEDMTSFEIPDRLSILTYLSQFYQVFAAQEAHKRLKRSSSSGAEEAQIPKGSGSPSKMAHVVGVPKRDPCRRCQLPVFLAERLMVGKKVYHRTCLKCSRCCYQLTPGSFYETETDDQYCCETCPDEENSVDSISVSSEISESATNVELRKSSKNETLILEPSPISGRSSIRTRLAFFENHTDNREADRKLLQNSLSDEEKSKSLKKVENYLETIKTSYKSNPAFSNFLKNSTNSEEAESELQNSKIETSDSEDDNIELTSSELSKSLSPLIDTNLDKTEDKKYFVVSTQLVLNSSSNIDSFDIIDDQQNTIEDSAKKKQNSDLNSVFSNDSTNKNNNGEQVPITTAKTDSSSAHQSQGETNQVYSEVVEDNLGMKEHNDNYCITKEKSENELNTDSSRQDVEHILCRKDTTNAETKLITQLDKIGNVLDNEFSEGSFVELRTHSKIENINKSQFEDNKTTKPHIAESLHLQQSEITITNETPGEIFVNEKNNISNVINPDFLNVDNHEKSTTSLNYNKTERENLNTNLIIDTVPLETKSKDNETLEYNLRDNKGLIDEKNSKENLNEIQKTQTVTDKSTFQEYPDDLNPFKSDEEYDDKENVELKNTTKQVNLNPFDSSDDEVELERTQILNNKIPKVPPPRPPPPRVSTNPFGSEDEDEVSVQNFTRPSSLIASQNGKTPIPTPRTNKSQSQNATREPTPRISTKAYMTTTNSESTPPLPISSDLYGSVNSLCSNNTTAYNHLRNSDLRSSNHSLNLSAGGTLRSRKPRRAPLPPAPVKELFPSNETINSGSKASTPSSSAVGTPKSSRKKRPAPAPPKPSRLETFKVPEINVDTVSTQPKNLNNYPLQSESDSKLSDEEKALLEGKILQSLQNVELDLSLSPASRRSSKRLITLDKELLEEHGLLQNEIKNNSQCDDLKQQNQQKTLTVYDDEASIVYRRILIPQNLETPTHEQNPAMEDNRPSLPPGERHMKKVKDNKDANNCNRQSQISVSSSVADDTETTFNKSAHGKWKRRKGPAPALPLPPRKVLQMLPLQEIKHELEIIEVQQQGLEKQGVILEKMIRDRCEGVNEKPFVESEEFASGSSTENSKEVENFILQLFELVNEKNELFRRQAELMYLRRQHRLEQEQADLEYEIRILMAQPEQNKTDSDKAREEALIERLLEVVKLRNEVVECLEMDRLREAEEDQSIKQSLQSHIAKREDAYYGNKTLSKKEKKKQKEAKRLCKNKKLDADKDADESELNVEKQKSKKKKKLLVF